MGESKGKTFVGGWPRRAKSPIRKLVSKIGGAPVGITDDQWPLCKMCGRRQDFLLQLDLRSPELLSRRFGFAYVFMCHGETCPTYFGEYGTNHLLLVDEPSKRVPGVSGVQVWPEYALKFGPYRREEYEPGDSAALNLPLIDLVIDACDRAQGEEVVLEVPPDLMPQDPPTVYLGGEPACAQNEEKPTCPGCGGIMRFIARIESQVEPHEYEKEGVFLPFSGGCAYAFICDKECSPTGTYLMWQCT